MLHVEELGEGFAVLLLHGMPTAPAHLRPLAESLAATGFRALLPHLSGYGQSEPLSPYTFEASQAALYDTLAALGIRELSAVGFSAGAYRAFSMALGQRVEVRAIACIGAIAHFSEKVELYRSYAKMLRDHTANVAATCEELMLSPTGRNSPSAVADVRAWPSATTDERLAAELEAMCAVPDLRPELARLSAPILLRVGSDDSPAPPEISREIASLAPSSTLEVVPNVGHALLSEDFAATSRSIREFLVAHC